MTLSAKINGSKVYRP